MQSRDSRLSHRRCRARVAIRHNYVLNRRSRFWRSREYRHRSGSRGGRTVPCLYDSAYANVELSACNRLSFVDVVKSIADEGDVSEVYGTENLHKKQSVCFTLFLTYSSERKKHTLRISLPMTSPLEKPRMILTPVFVIHPYIAIPS